MTLLPGVRLGPYEILALVGTGGMGEVYRARDTRLGRDVAIKILTEGHLDSSEMLLRFQREARAIAGLTHPHIARLYDIGEHDRRHFLVMEFLDGETLSWRLRAGRLPLADALRHSADIADALDHAHHAGVVHRDLKPANIILTATGAKLLDFGLAKVIPAADSASTEAPITERGGIVGTYRYMAPEQFDGRDATTRTDVFALGAVMFEMITGQRAFAGTTMPSIAAAVLHDVPVPLSRLEPLVPPALDRLVRKCLAKDPDERWAAASEVRDRVRAVPLATGRAPRTRPAASTADPSSSHRATSARVRGVAVLPLHNLSGDPSQDYFADGMTESLITSLAKIGALKVISRTSVMSYKESRKPLREIAKELKVDTILEGSVTRSHDHIGINLQLVRATTDSPIWAERYNRSFTDVLEVQGEVAHAVADAIRVTISPIEKARLQAAPKVVREAHDEFLRGQFTLKLGTKDGLTAALVHFTRAIECDPHHALSHAGLAKYYDLAGVYRLIPYREAFRSGRRAVLEAIRLDPTLATAYAALGALSIHEWDISAANRAFEQALQLDPHDSLTRQECARYWMYLGRFDDAIAHVEIAQEVDPRSPGPTTTAAAVFYAAGDCRRAVLSADRAIAVAPPSPPAQYLRSLALAELGEWDASLDAMLRAVETSGRQPNTLAGLASIHARRGARAEADPLLIELERRCGDGEVTPFNLAEAYAGLRQLDRALRRLEEAYQLRVPDLIGIAVDPIFAEVRQLPAFRDLVARVGLA